MGRRKIDYFDDAALVGRRIREARQAAGLTQKDLSFDGCTSAYISRIENGERVPSLQILRVFSKKLGVSEDYLARGDTPVAEADLVAEARVAVRVGDLDAASQLADAALTAARSNVDRARASAIYGEIHLHNGDPRAAVDAVERARKLWPEIEKHDPHVAEVLGRAYARAFEYESAIAVFARAREASSTAGDALGEARFAALLANAFAESGNFAQAEEALGRAVALADQVADPVSRARLLWSQSRVRQLQNDTVAAALYAQQALEVLEVSDQTYYAALAHQLLAHIELDRGNGERAIELLERAAPLIDASGRPFERASFRVERARALLKVGRQEEAAAIAMEAAASLSQLSPVDAGRSYALLAEAFEELGDEERAAELYELALERLEATPNRYAVETFSRFAALLERRGRKDEAYELLKRAMNVQQQADRALAPRRDASDS